MVPNPNTERAGISILATDHGLKNPVHKPTKTCSTELPIAPPPPRVRTPQKRGKGIDPSESEVVMLLRKVAATKVHIAPHVSKIDAFKVVANAFNGKIEFVPHIDAKSICDRYERLQRAFVRDNNRDAMRSGVGGQITKQEELLSSMQETREEQSMKKLWAKESAPRREQKKLEAGELLVANATSSAASVLDESDHISDNSDSAPQQKKWNEPSSSVAMWTVR